MFLPEVLRQITWEPEVTQEALRVQPLVYLPSGLSQYTGHQDSLQFLAAPGSPPLAKATYPGKARAGPGSEPTDKK